MYIKSFNIMAAFLVISGCSSKKVLAPVSDYQSPPSTKVAHHTVAPGETLYSIAWRYNLDYKTLAQANGIAESYTIYPGQKIHLKKPKKPIIITKNTSVDVSKKPIPKIKTHTQVIPPSSNSRLKNKPLEVKKHTSSKVSSQKVAWRWPAEGKILKGFQANSGLSKGIDISGKLGEPVRAAASGIVVYSGEGLRGYGKLVIIKHSEKYLSAYAHNRRLLVKEGDTVKLSEKIAEMGQSGTNTIKLHFEIRFDGKPINPLVHLPPR